MENKLEFRTRTCIIRIYYDRCIAPKCGFACVKADRLYGRGVLRIQDGKPILNVNVEKAARLCNECLACEIHCRWAGADAVEIIIPL